MSAEIDRLLANNQVWAARTAREDPGFFSRLAARQQPDILWIGCSDSRVPASQVTGTVPGEMFVHRNVANVIRSGDLSSRSVIGYAVGVLQVKHVIACGHLRCGGVQAAMAGQQPGDLSTWLHDIHELYQRNRADLDEMDEREAWDRLCVLNVQQQVENICRLEVVKDAWREKRDLTVHGWIYDLTDGMLREACPSVDAQAGLSIA